MDAHHLQSIRQHGMESVNQALMAQALFSTFVKDRNRAGLRIAQHQDNVHVDNIQRIEYSAQVAANTAYAGTYVDVDISPTNHVCLDLVLEMEFTNSTGADIYTIPVPQWIDRIELKPQEAGQKQQVYGDALLLNTLFQSKEAAAAAFKNWHMNYKEPDFKENTDAWPDGEQRVFHIHVPCFLTEGKVFLGGLAERLRIRTHFWGSTYWLLSGSVPTLNGLRYIVTGKQVSLANAEHLRAAMMSQAGDYTIRYVEPVQSTHKLSITAGNEASVELNSVRGKVAFTLFFLRDNAASGKSLRKYYYVENYRLTDTASVNLIGGTNIRSPEALEVQSIEHFNSDVFLNVPIYVITHTSSPPAVVHGMGILGLLEYNRNKIVITPGASRAEVNEVQTINFTRVADSGSFQLTFRGYTTALLAFGATAATIETALEGLPSIGFNNVSVTGTTATSVAITFQNDLGGQPLGSKGHYMRLHGTLEESNTAVVAATTLTTPGVASGNLDYRYFETGTYDLIAYSYMYRTLKVRRGIIYDNVHV